MFEPPGNRAKWTLIFSSPNHLRKLADPIDTYFQAFEDKGAIVAGYFFKNGFGNTNIDSYDLVHINPPVLQDNTIVYMSFQEYTFASDFVFQKLMSPAALMAEAASWFNARGDLTSDKLGAASAGDLFEKICLWMVRAALREDGQANSIAQEGILTLLILPVTVHPVKANGLKDFVQAFPEHTRSLVARKLVTPLNGKLTHYCTSSSWPEWQRSFRIAGSS
eukprot:gene29800-38949_t